MDVGKVIAGTHRLTYVGIGDGAPRMVAEYRRHDGIGFLCFRRVDGGTFAHMGRKVKRYEPLTNEREAVATLANIIADPSSRSQLEARP